MLKKLISARTEQVWLVNLLHMDFSNTIFLSIMTQRSLTNLCHIQMDTIYVIFGARESIWNWFDFHKFATPVVPVLIVKLGLTILFLTIIPVFRSGLTRMFCKFSSPTRSVGHRGAAFSWIPSPPAKIQCSLRRGASLRTPWIALPLLKSEIVQGWDEKGWLKFMFWVVICVAVVNRLSVCGMLPHFMPTSHHTSLDL